MNEPAIVDAAAHGDRAAFALLAERSINRLFAIATLILRDRSLAEDAVQEALVRAWRDLPTLRDTSRWDAWLRRLTVHACYDEARRRRRHPATLTLLPEHDRATMADAAASLEDRDRLDRAFVRLSPEHRAAIVLHHYAGLPLADMAESLGIPVGTVKSRLHHARLALRAAIDSDDRLGRVSGGTA